MQTPQVDPEAQCRFALAKRWGAGPLGCRLWVQGFLWGLENGRTSSGKRS